MKYLLIILIFLIVGCKAKQITTEKIITKTDTIYKNKVETIEVPVNNTLVVEQPCDSTGVLRAFKQTFKTKTVYVTIEGKDNVITANINLDSIKQSTIEEYKSSISTEKEVITVTKFKNKKVMWYSLGANIVLLMFIFRKFIPFLRFIPF